MRRALSTAFIPSLFLIACSGEDPSVSPPADAGIVVDASTKPPADAGVDPGLPPATQTGTRAFSSRTWRVGQVTQQVIDGAGGDPVLRAIGDGTFAFPDVGADEDGVMWRDVELADDGELQFVGFGAGDRYYAVAAVPGSMGRGLSARVARFAEAYVEGRRVPSDPYGTNRHRVPLPLAEEENLIVLVNRIGNPFGIVSFEATDDRVLFNPRDLTVPNLREGDDSIQYIGVPVLNFEAGDVTEVTARIEESDHFHASALDYPSLPPSGLTKIAFELRPKATWSGPDTEIPVKMRLDVGSLGVSFAFETMLTVVEALSPHRRTFLSSIDRSAQFYGLRLPSNPEGAGLVLSLHGASVDARGQARAYSTKDWAYLVAATNRRPFGFDWEDWGRLDALEVLADAKASFTVNEERIHLTGHSMGGHGSWQLGVLHTHEFASIGPSAGWSHFDAYGGSRIPPNLPLAFTRAQASSYTLDFLDNYRNRLVYIIHGDADRTVPVSLSRDMNMRLMPIAEELYYHEEPGADHWWDADPDEPGTDCVDWEPMFALMADRRRDLAELDFTYVSPSPGVSNRYSFVRLVAAEDPYRNVTVTSSSAGDRVDLVTDNVVALEINAPSLKGKNVTRLVISGSVSGEVDLTTEDREWIRLGGPSGKRPGLYGPFKQAFFDEFCVVYAGGADGPFGRFSSYLAGVWTILGNGYACTLPASAGDDAFAGFDNRIYVGADKSVADPNDTAPLDWDTDAVRLGARTFQAPFAAAFVFPRTADHLGAVIHVSPDALRSLYTFVPFSSGFGFPDYTVLTENGLVAGFFDESWQLDPSLER